MSFACVRYSFRAGEGIESVWAARRCLSAAGRERRRWGWQQCRRTARCKRCWSSAALPASSGRPAGPPPASESPPARRPPVLSAARQPASYPLCLPVVSWLLIIPPGRCSARASAVPSEAGGTPGETGSVCLSRPWEALRSAGPVRRRPSARWCRSEWVWGCRWSSGAPPAGNDGFQPEPWGPPAGSLGPSELPAANSSAPASKKYSRLGQRFSIMEYLYDLIVSKTCFLFYHQQTFK